MRRLWDISKSGGTLIPTLSKIRQTKSSKLPGKKKSLPMSKLVCQWQGARLDREQGWKFSDQVRPFYHPLNVKLLNSQRRLFWQLLKENKSKTKQIQTLQTTRKIRKKQKRKTKTHIREGAAASVVTNPFSHSLLKSKTLPSFHTSSFPLVSHHQKDQQEILGFFCFLYHITAAWFFVQL